MRIGGKRSVKGRIIKAKNDKLYVVTENGDFISARQSKNFECGDEVEVRGDFIPKYVKVAVVIGIILFAIFWGVYSYNIPKSYVEISINPEIMLSLNAYDRVISVHGENEDGRKIAATEGIKNQPVDKSVANIVSIAQKMGYMASDNGSRDMVIAVYGSHAQKVRYKLAYENIRMAEPEDCTNAAAANIPVGKYILMRELNVLERANAVDGLGNVSILSKRTTAENIKKMTVRQIIDSINEQKQIEQTRLQPIPDEIDSANQSEMSDSAINEDNTAVSADSAVDATQNSVNEQTAAAVSVSEQFKKSVLNGISVSMNLVNKHNEEALAAAEPTPQPTQEVSTPTPTKKPTTAKAKTTAKPKTSKTTSKSSTTTKKTTTKKNTSTSSTVKATATPSASTKDDEDKKLTTDAVSKDTTKTETSKETSKDTGKNAQTTQSGSKSTPVPSKNESSKTDTPKKDSTVINRSEPKRPAANPTVNTSSDEDIKG